MKDKYWMTLVISVALVSAFLLTACSTPAPTTKPAQQSTSATPSQTISQAPVQAKTFKFAYSMPKGKSVAAGCC